MAVSLQSGQRLGAPSRIDTLPQASITFLVLVIVLAAYYTNNCTTRSFDRASNSVLNFSSVRSAAGYGDLCTSDNIFSNRLSLLFLIPGVIFSFIGLAVVTDEYFIPALERICERLHLTEDVAGATFMAAGSSTPEFFASMLGVFVTEDEVGVGTIVGSAVFNVLVIIGLSAALAVSVLSLDWRPLARDSFFYVLSIVLLIIFILGPSKGEIEWWEGLILFCTYLLYVLFMAYGNKPYMTWAEKLKTRIPKNNDVENGIQDSEILSPTEFSPQLDSGDGNTLPCPGQTLSPPRYDDINPRSKFRAVHYAVIAANRLAATSAASGVADGNPDSDGESSRRSFLGIDLPTTTIGWVLIPITFPWKLVFKLTIVDCSVEKRAHLWWLTFALSIIWISGISFVMVEAARIAGCLLGIPATAMGLTVIAAGTSVPDALASVTVARSGLGDMAVSNALGSNIFDILLGLGFPWFLGALIKGNRIIVPAEPIGAVVIPIAILFAIIIALVVLLVLMRWKLRPLLGYILFAIYGVFVAYTLLDVYVFKVGQAEE